MKRIILITFITLFNNYLYAYDFEFEGITYSIISDNELEVSDNHTVNYYSNNDLIIPSEITYNNQVYKVTQIGEYAFDNDYFSKIKLPTSIKKICRGAFRYCEKLENITIPNSVSEIAYKAFEQNNILSTICFESSKILFSEEAIVSCPQLQSIYVKDETPQEISSISFSKAIYTSATLYVPIGKKDVYMITQGWNEFKEIIETDFSTLDIKTIVNNDKKESIYNLSGQHLKGIKKEINIINGKKVLAH